MIALRLSPTSKPHAVHPEWCARALPDVTDPDLRAALLGAERFAERILSGLIQQAFGRPSVPGAAPDPRLEDLASMLDDAVLARLGRFWFAPVLSAALLAAGLRSGWGVEDRDTLRRIMSYRDHASADLIGPLPQPPDFSAAGAACLHAWLDTMPAGEAPDRMRLLLPPRRAVDRPLSGRRAALVERVLADGGLKGTN